MSVNQTLHVGFVGSFPPRRCGIAAYTSDLVQAVTDAGAKCSVVAIDDGLHEYEYPETVSFSVRCDDEAAYADSARRLLAEGIDIACVQHEYGLYGGPAGECLLRMMRELHVPIVTTLHTVLKQPGPDHRRVLEEIIELSERVVVMSTKARSLLLETHGVEPDKIDLIYHGAPVPVAGEMERHRERLGLSGKRVILTFGLLGPDKGIEYMIEAMPRIVESHPDAYFVVLGQTHPHVAKASGESYRESLQSLASNLNMKDHVRFENRFVSTPELIEYMLAADVYVSPYTKLEQVTSGTLTYAVAFGKPVVSTPYWHAEELLADKRGILVPPKDAAALGDAITMLFGDPEMMHAMEARTAEFGARMRWPVVGEAYVRCFRKSLKDSADRLRSIVGRNVEPEWIAPPFVRIDHYIGMHDDTGMIQHAVGAIPSRVSGYCTDDNARALICASLLSSDSKFAEMAHRLAWRHVAFLNHAFDRDTGLFRNFLGYDRNWMDVEPSQDAHGRALWGLGVAQGKLEDSVLAHSARELFRKGRPAVWEMQYLRSIAFSALGLDAYLENHVDDPEAILLCGEIGERLFQAYELANEPGWRWYEDFLSYDNARLPQALILCAGRSNRPDWMRAALQSLEWSFGEQTGPNGCYWPVGSNGFYAKGGKKALYDQQPLEAYAMADACLAAEAVTHEPIWRRRAEKSYQWFNGANSEGMSLIDHETGACMDGLEPGWVNENRGAESTLAYLAATLSVRESCEAGSLSAKVRFSA